MMELHLQFLEMSFRSLVHRTTHLGMAETSVCFRDTWKPKKNQENTRYLDTKRERLGHLLDETKNSDQD